MNGIQIPNIVVIGSINMDIMVDTPHIPKAGQTRIGSAVKLLPGGKGANQAVAASRLASNTTLIGAVGNDSFGEQMLLELERQAVNCAVTVMPGESTGVASVWIHNQDNRIVVVPGASKKFTWDNIEQSFIDHADVVLLQLEISFETAVQSIAYAHSLGKKIVLNPAPARHLPDEIYPMLYSLTPNRDELAVLAQSPEVLDASNWNALHRAMEKMIDKGLYSIAVTLGSDGAIFMDASGHAFHVPGRDINVLDTTGAGDCFNAAFAVSIARGWSMERAVEYAVAASALAVTKFGAQNGMPAMDEVSRLLAASLA